MRKIIATLLVFGAIVAATAPAASAGVKYVPHPYGGR